MYENKKKQKRKRSKKIFKTPVLSVLCLLKKFKLQHMQESTKLH